MSSSKKKSERDAAAQRPSANKPGNTQATVSYDYQCDDSAPAHPLDANTSLVPERDDTSLIAYDENLLERARNQWQFGDWESLSSLSRGRLQNHPDRAKLALLAAAGSLQVGNSEQAREFTRLARDWGCDGLLINRVLISGVYNSLGRAAASAGQGQRAFEHFETAMAIGSPGSDLSLVTQARINSQVRQLGHDRTLRGAQTEFGKSIVQLYSEHSGLVSDKWNLYLHVYDRIFSEFRYKPISLLEVGIQNGGSLEIWEKYFYNPKAIVGCDVNEDCATLTYSSEVIDLVIGDIKDTDTQVSILSDTPAFDIIIDDGSHVSADIIAMFCDFFPRLKHDGVYVVEDLHCSYWGEYGGGLNNEKSAVEFFKHIIDILNAEHWVCTLTRSQFMRQFGETRLTESVLAEISTVEFCNSMCVIRKRRTNENLLGRRRVVGDLAPVYDIRQLGTP